MRDEEQGRGEGEEREKEAAFLDGRVLDATGPDVPVSELLFELPIQEMLYELIIARTALST